MTAVIVPVIHGESMWAVARRIEAIVGQSLRLVEPIDAMAPESISEESLRSVGALDRAVAVHLVPAIVDRRAGLTEGPPAADDVVAAVGNVKELLAADYRALRVGHWALLEVGDVVDEVEEALALSLLEDGIVEGVLLAGSATGGSVAHDHAELQCFIADAAVALAATSLAADLEGHATVYGVAVSSVSYSPQRARTLTALDRLKPTLESPMLETGGNAVTEMGLEFVRKLGLTGESHLEHYLESVRGGSVLANVRIDIDLDSLSPDHWLGQLLTAHEVAEAFEVPRAEATVLENAARRVTQLVEQTTAASLDQLEETQRIGAMSEFATAARDGIDEVLAHLDLPKDHVDEVDWRTVRAELARVSRWRPAAAAAVVRIVALAMVVFVLMRELVGDFTYDLPLIDVPARYVPSVLIVIVGLLWYRGRVGRQRRLADHLRFALDHHHVSKVTEAARDAHRETLRKLREMLGGDGLDPPGLIDELESVLTAHRSLVSPVAERDSAVFAYPRSLHATEVPIDMVDAPEPWTCEAREACNHLALDLRQLKRESRSLPNDPAHYAQLWTRLVDSHADLSVLDRNLAEQIASSPEVLGLIRSQLGLELLPVLGPGVATDRKQRPVDRYLVSGSPLGGVLFADDAAVGPAIQSMTGSLAATVEGHVAMIHLTPLALGERGSQ